MASDGSKEVDVKKTEPGEQEQLGPQDAPMKEVLLYAFGNVENGIANQFFNIIKTVMVVAMFVNPLLVGLVIGLKTVWDAITDPIFAHISDNTRSRWGRRIPYILVGGVTRIAMLVVMAIYFPATDDMASNMVLEADSTAKEMKEETVTAADWLKASLGQIEEEKLRFKVRPDDRELIAAIAAGPLDEHQREDLTERLAEFTEFNAQAMEEALIYHPVLLDELEARQERLDVVQKQQDALGEDTSETDRAVVAELLRTRTKPLENTEKQIKMVENAVYRAKLTDQIFRSMLTQIQGSQPVAIPDQALSTIMPLLPPEFPKAMVTAREELTEASQDIRQAFALATKAEGDVFPQAQIDKIEDAMASGADAAGTLRGAREALASLTDQLQQAADAAAASIDDGSQEAMLVALGRKRAFEGRLEAAQNFLEDIDKIDDRLAAHNQAYAQLTACREGNLSVKQAREQVDAILKYFTTAAKEKKRKGTFQKIKEGWQEFNNPANADKKGVVVYILIGFLIFTTLTTVQSTSYYALGIELCPSYDGRTKVVMYRSYMDKIAGIVAPYIPILCFLPMFDNALQGLFWVAVIACAIGIPSTVLMCFFVKERTHISVAKAPVIGDKPRTAIGAAIGSFAGMFRAFVGVASNVNYMRILAFYVFMGFANGLFQFIGAYLTIYYVVGSALEGAKWGAYIATVAWVLGLIMLPVIKWGCDKYQKHNMLRFGLITMAIGSIIKWWVIVPGHPEYQLILPFFFSIGIGTFYTVLSTMMADVTDEDELRHGVRREGMFGASMAFLMKIIGSVTPALAGVVVWYSGFDPALEYNQTPETYWWMRFLYSFVPGGMVLSGLLLTIKYPLTRERVNEIKRLVAERRRAQEAATSDE